MTLDIRGSATKIFQQSWQCSCASKDQINFFHLLLFLCQYCACTCSVQLSKEKSAKFCMTALDVGGKCCSKFPIVITNIAHKRRSSQLPSSVSGFVSTSCMCMLRTALEEEIYQLACSKTWCEGEVLPKFSNYHINNCIPTKIKSNSFICVGFCLCITCTCDQTSLEGKSAIFFAITLDTGVILPKFYFGTFFLLCLLLL